MRSTVMFQNAFVEFSDCQIGSGQSYFYFILTIEVVFVWKSTEFSSRLRQQMNFQQKYYQTIESDGVKRYFCFVTMISVLQLFFLTQKIRIDVNDFHFVLIFSCQNEPNIQYIIIKHSHSSLSHSLSLLHTFNRFRFSCHRMLYHYF